MHLLPGLVHLGPQPFQRLLHLPPLFLLLLGLGDRLGFLLGQLLPLLLPLGQLFFPGLPLLLQHLLAPFLLPQLFFQPPGVLPVVLPIGLEHRPFALQLGQPGLDVAQAHPHFLCLQLPVPHLGRQPFGGLV